MQRYSVKVPVHSHSKLWKANTARVPKQTAVTKSPLPGKTVLPQCSKDSDIPRQANTEEALLRTEPAAPEPPRGEHFKCESPMRSYSQDTNYNFVMECFGTKGILHSLDFILKDFTSKLLRNKPVL